MLPGVNHCYWLWLHVMLLKSTDAETLICAGKWGRCPSVISSSHPGNSCKLDLAYMKIISFVIIYILYKRCCWYLAPEEYGNICKAKENFVSKTWGPEQNQRRHSSNGSICMNSVLNEGNLFSLQILILPFHLITNLVSCHCFFLP